MVWYEDDRRPIPQPSERDPSLVWDYVDQAVILPFKRATHPARIIRNIGSLFGGDHAVPAANVNILDEVPNNTWFRNRIGLFPMTPEEAARGPGDGEGPDRSGGWTVISAKTEGVTPGFVIRDLKGDTYLIKFDPPGFLGMTTGAGVITNRILYAAGYNVPDDNMVVFDRSDLILGENVKVKLPDGSKHPMTEDYLDAIFEKVEKLPDGRILAIASKFVDGKPIGPFSYRSTRRDDPNDRIRHRHRRELRGLRVFASWLGHFDTKQHNSLDAYVPEGDAGHVRHYLIDFASTLGSGAKGPCPRHGYEYMVDWAIVGRTLALGLYEDPWRRVSRPEGLDEIGYFESRIYEPKGYKPHFPNSAFANCTDRDGYWAAKIISAFTDEILEAIVKQARYRNPESSRFMVRMLGERRDKTVRYFFDRVPPLDFFTHRSGKILFHDLGVERGYYSKNQTRYRARAAALNESRHAGRWSDWIDLNDTMISLDREPASDLLSSASTEHYPFLAVECTVDRGEGWSDCVRVYVARASGRLAAVERGKR